MNRDAVTNSSQLETLAPKCLIGLATNSDRAAQPPLPGCPVAPLPRDHFPLPRRRLTPPAPGAPTMAAVLAQIAGLS